jgi:hypothetical protein
MTQPESLLSGKIQDALRRQGWFCFKVHGNEHMTAGLPDIIVCAEGVFVGLETKMPDKRNNTSARQDYIHDKIRQAKGTAVVVCSPAEAVRVVKVAIEGVLGKRQERRHR